MKDAEIAAALKRIREALVLTPFVQEVLGDIVAELEARALEANPPLEAPVLAEVDALMYTFRNSGMSRIWVHFPAPPGVSEGSEMPVTVTIRGRGDVPEPPAISSSIR